MATRRQTNAQEAPAAPVTATQAVAGPAPEAQIDKDEALAVHVLKMMAPFLKQVIVAVLKTEQLGPQRAYILSDIPRAMAGDRQATFQLRDRVRAAGMEPTMNRLAGKISGECATPLYQSWKDAADETAAPTDKTLEESIL